MPVSLFSCLKPSVLLLGGDAPWKVLLGSAAVGLLSAGYSPGLKHIPGLSLPGYGAAEPAGSSSGVLLFLCLRKPLAALPFLPTLLPL